jgi:hemoglobin
MHANRTSNMTLPLLLVLALAAMLATGCAPADETGDAASAPAAEEAAPTDAEPTPADQARELEAMCSENAEAMAARQAESSLYERLGGTDRIHDIVTEIVRLHGENEAIQGMFEGVDREGLIDGVAEFLVVGSGGPGEYTGLGMEEAHAHLRLTNADFLAAGGDVMQAMRNKGCGEEEIQEVVCALVALRAQVVMESDRTL